MEALSSTLADAAAVHRASVTVAAEDAVQARLLDRAVRLEALSAQVRPGIADDDHSSGSLLVLLDRLRLQIDRWFGDDNDAADTASREAISHLVQFIDGQIQNTELSAETRSVFVEVRGKVTSNPAAITDTDLTALPS